jgi:cysteinyl-tRNA synthetase
MLQVEGKKMSKSLGNFFTVRDLLDQGIPGEVIRFVLLMTHYRSPMDWTDEKRVVATTKLEDYLALGERFADLGKARETLPAPEVVAALADDLNTHLALSEIDSLLGNARWEELVATLDFVGLIPFSRFDERRALLDAFKSKLHQFASKLEAVRTTAMASKDFSAVDALKSALTAAGVEVRMSKSGVELVPGPDFDPAKLEALQ